MKKWLYLLSLMLLFVANINAAGAVFYGERDEVAAKGEVVYFGQVEMMR